MKTTSILKVTVISLIAIGLVALTITLWQDDGVVYDLLFHLQDSLDKGEDMRDAFLTYGFWAPLLFVIIQILQVILAPIPGEASGILGGYLFGLWPGLLYSTAGLTIGSWLAFAAGRFLGNIFHIKIRDTRVYQRFNHLVYKGGFVIPFVLFLFPGFPKDSLSYLLGFSRMPMRVFVFVAAVGRIPGTLMLSAQGAQVYQGDYIQLLVLLSVTAIVTVPFYLFRKQIMHRLQIYHTLMEESDESTTQEKND